MVQSIDSAYLIEMNSSSLDQFVSTKDGALDVIAWLRGGVKSRLHYRQIRPYVAALARCSVYQVYSLPEELTIHRARHLKENKWPESVADLGPPPPHKASNFGRCHQPNQPICYCSLYEDTALAEINAELAAQYVVATFKLPENIRFISIGDFDCYRRTGKTSIGEENPVSVKAYAEIPAKEDWIIPALIDAFLADEFIKRATLPTDYKITSALSEVLLNGTLNPSHPIDAIIYPSVEFRHGVNFAVRPDANPYTSKLKLVEAETKIIEITDVVGYGIFGYRQLATLKPVNFRGLLDWDPTKESSQ